MISRLPFRPLIWTLITIMPGLAAAESGPYLGGAIGSASVDDDFAGFDIADDVDAYKLLIGMQLGATLGIEAGYQNLGEFEERTNLGATTVITELAAEGWTLGGTLALPVSDFVSLFARGGIFVWDADIDIDGIRRAVADDSNPYYGAGAKVGFTNNFSLVGDWTRYELEDVNSDVISIGLEYRFGD